MKKYGIFIAYSPNTSLLNEGLGRYLTAFLKAATARGDTHFAVLCPSWSRDSLARLCAEGGISPQSFTLLSPHRPPLLYRLYQFMERSKRPRQARQPFQKLHNRARRIAADHANWLKNHIASARSVTGLIALLAYGFFLTIPIAVAVLIFRLVRLSRNAAYRQGRLARRRLARLPAAISRSSIVAQLHQSMLDREAAAMIKIGNADKTVGAWYTPAAFWSIVNELDAPALVCVPDVVLTEFPIGFALVGGAPALRAYESVEKTIDSSRNFVTYSEHVKRQTLVHRFGIDPSIIHTIRHAPNDLSSRMTVTGFPDNDATSRAYAEGVLLGAVRKSTHGSYAGAFNNSKVKFLVYPSQFRPSKNLITLLRAYEWLLRKRHIGHKLILTGEAEYPDVKVFLEERNLREDVLCLHGLSETELAACYKLADLAVNPSLFEGGMPFTFSEALSVGTPVVMGDIDVTREIITDPALRAASLFDPYDWRAMAAKIEWALDNREGLYAQQRKFYDDVLAKRTWDDVVAEHVAILDQIAAQPRRPAAV
ncbi:glycosyltransferase [Mesorhizobium australicum]|uniref:glycosyltransferase n=1 Tax=Mesorhizobium australicum TaxID=536018 RepID=UPI00333C1ECC